MEKLVPSALSTSVNDRRPWEALTDGIATNRVVAICAPGSLMQEGDDPTRPSLVVPLSAVPDKTRLLLADALPGVFGTCKQF